MQRNFTSPRHSLGALVVARRTEKNLRLQQRTVIDRSF
jgi:hypothetical protein